MASLTLGHGTRRYFRNFNWALVVSSILVTVLGVVCIQSASLHHSDLAGEAHRQIIFAVVGFVGMFGISFVDYRNWRRIAPALYVVTVLLLIFILLRGHSALGAQRWISLGPLEFQPSELSKLVVAIAVAGVLCNGTYAKLQDLWKPLLLAGLPALLVLRQPDLGTTLVILAILTAQLFLGLRNVADFLLYLGGAVVAASAVLVSNVLKPFQKARLLVFLNPKADPQGAGYNLNQSKIAVGNGEIVGRGLFHGTQTQLSFVPENSRDFVFTVLAEEFGFIGAMCLIAFYGVMLYGGVRAVLAARDRFGSLLAVGLVAMLAFHILVNVGMTIGIMPITGIPLPFMSYGGSAIITNFLAVGILMNIYSQRDRDVLGNA